MTENDEDHSDKSDTESKGEPEVFARPEENGNKKVSAVIPL